MNKRFALVAVCAVAALGAYAAAFQAVTIAWSPKVGQSYTYKTHAVIHGVPGGPNGPADLKFDSKMVITDKEIRPDRTVVVESKQSDFVAFLGDLDLAAMGQALPKEITETTVQKMNGEVISKTSDAPAGTDSPRLDAMTQFMFPSKPVSVGDTWTRSLKGDKSKGTYDSTTTFKYAGTDTVAGVPVYRMDVDYKETNASTNVTATGTFWMGQSDGELVKGELKVKNAVFGPGLPPSDGEITVNRA